MHKLKTSVKKNKTKYAGVSLFTLQLNRISC